MATSTLRFAIIVALAVGGVLLISQLPQGSTSASGGTGKTQSPTPSSTGQTNPGGNGQQSPPPPVRGVRVAVYNGTYQTGLAGETALKLEQRFGYKIDPKTSILDAGTKPLEQTTLYYVTPADKVQAEALANGFFKKLQGVKIAKLPAGSNAPAGVQVAIYLGTDYAALR